MRIEFDSGWGLIRYSNTSPNLTIRYEADSEKNLHKIQDELQGVVNNLLKEVKE